MSEEITRINCAEQMPPRTYEDAVIIKGYPDEQLMFMSAADCNLLLPNYDKVNRGKCAWTPYTPEKWKELNNGRD